MTRSLLAALVAAAALMPAAAAETVAIGSLSYPEGAFYRDGRLFITEMGTDTVSVLEHGKLVPFWKEAGCGPTAVASFAGKDFLVLCHLGAHVVHVDAAGRTVASFDTDGDGGRLKDPNDAFEDGQGGVYFSDPGLFSKRAAPAGSVMHISAEGRISRLASGLAYPNGVYFDAAHRELLVSIHMRDEIMRFAVGATPTELEPREPISLAKLSPQTHKAIPESGPDGLELDAEGRLWIAKYGEGRVMVLDKERRYLGSLDVGYDFVTSISTTSQGSVAIVGTADTDWQAPAGRLDVNQASDLIGRLRR